MSQATILGVDEVHPLPLRKFQCTRAEAHQVAQQGVALLVEDILPDGRLQGRYTTMRPMTYAVRLAIKQMYFEAQHVR